MSIPSYRTRKEVDSLQAQAREVNTALNSLVIGVGISGTRNKFLDNNGDSRSVEETTVC